MSAILYRSVFMLIGIVERKQNINYPNTCMGSKDGPVSGPPPLRCVRGCKLDMRVGSKVVFILLFSISWFASLTSVIQRVHVDAEKS